VIDSAQMGAAILRWRRSGESFALEAFAHDPHDPTKPVEIDAAQAEMLNANARYDFTATRSCHGSGKTSAAAIEALRWVSVYEHSLCVTTAGTWGHLEDKLWPEIAIWYKVWCLRDDFELLDRSLRHKKYPKSWRIEASSSNKPENVEGWHSRNLKLIIDEAKAMSSDLYGALRGAMTGNKESGRQGLNVFSTPPLADVGWYADLFSRKSAGWKLIHIPYTKSTRVSREWAEDLRRDYGPESSLYVSKVLGEIPQNSASVVILTKWIEEAQRPGPPKREGTFPVIVTCDVAGEGEDLTVIGCFENGKFSVLQFSGSTDTMEVCGMMCRWAETKKAKYLVADYGGLGMGPVDRARERQVNGQFPKTCAIIAEKFGEGAERDDLYQNRKSELWWSLREQLRTGNLKLPDSHELAGLRLPRGSDLRTQLASPIFEEDSSSRIRVLDHKKTKSEKEKTLPSKSPDLAHALILGAALYGRLPREVEVQTPRADEYAQMEIDRRRKLREEEFKKALNRKPDQTIPDRYAMLGRR